MPAAIHNPLNHTVPVYPGRRVSCGTVANT